MTDFKTQPFAIDTEMASAYQRWSAGAWETRCDGPSTEQSRADENMLAIGLCGDPSGVAKKLRYALYLSASSPWLEALALGGGVPNLADRFLGEDTITETIWSAIQSLEAIGGSPDRAAWQKLVDAYDAALAAESAADDTRLTDLRSDAEDAVMAFPSPDASGFAIKYLIAKGGGRETNCWNNLLETEAKRFAGRTRS